MNASSMLPAGVRPFQAPHVHGACSAQGATQRRQTSARCAAAQERRCTSPVALQAARGALAGAASDFLGCVAAGALLLQPLPAAAVIDTSTTGATAPNVAGVAVTSGVNAVLKTQQDSLSPEELQKASDAGQTAAPPQIKAGQKVFFDMAVDGEAMGRVVVQLYDDVPVGAARFADLAQGKQGVGFRRTKFDAVNQEYIRDAGLRRLNFGSEQETPIAGGDGVDQLEVEIESDAAHRHMGRGDVSLVVRNDKPLQTKEKLTAYRGKLVKVQETLGERANGTSFVITLKPTPSLDATNLVVDGMDVVDALAALPAVRDNKDSGYIKTAKLIGDRRADVALRSFGRPFAKVTVAECGPVS